MIEKEILLCVSSMSIDSVDGVALFGVKSLPSPNLMKFGAVGTGI